MSQKSCTLFKKPYFYLDLGKKTENMLSKGKVYD
jgi:hypothetical protein